MAQTAEEAIDQTRKTPGVFYGTLRERSSGSGTTKFEFDVHEVFNGDFGPKVTLVHQENSSCFVDFERDSPTMVFASDADPLPFGPEQPASNTQWHPIACPVASYLSPDGERTLQERQIVLQAFGQPQSPDVGGSNSGDIPGPENTAATAPGASDYALAISVAALAAIVTGVVIGVLAPRRRR